MNITWARRKAKKIVNWGGSHYGAYLLGAWYVALFFILAWALAQPD